MRFDDLPNLALHKICLNLNSNDIASLREINQRLNNLIRFNRLYYSKINVASVRIFVTEDGQRKANVVWVKKNFERKLKILEVSEDYLFNSLNPNTLISYDHDELYNMSRLWWEERRNIELYNIVDYRRYLPHLDKCITIFLNSDKPKNLAEILASMEAKNLKQFSVEGDGKLECTDDDIRKIGRLSNKMISVNLENLSDSSNISNEAILDMIEIGCFVDHAQLRFSKIGENIEQCLSERDWVIECRIFEKCIGIKRFDGFFFWLHWGKENAASVLLLKFRQSFATRS